MIDTTALIQFAKSLGLARLADVTGLDDIGVPVYAAIAPTLNPELLSIYNGKGWTRATARRGALLELIERRTAAVPPIEPLVGTYFALSAAGHHCIDPRSIPLPPQSRDPRAVELEWTSASDGSRQQVWVPAGSVYFPYVPQRGVLLHHPNTNGLAAGTSVRDAARRASDELIERDALSLAILATRAGRQASVGQRVDPQQYPPRVRALVDRFTAAGVGFSLRRLPYGDRVRRLPAAALPAYVAVTLDRSPQGHPVLHMGSGAATSPTVAAERAVLEVAQSRLTEIQGVREDLRPVARRAARAKDVEQWFEGPFGDWLLASPAEGPACRKFGPVYIVKVTLPGSPVVVVRVIAPDLEVYAVDSDRIGSRGLAVLRGKS